MIPMIMSRALIATACPLVARDRSRSASKWIAPIRARVYAGIDDALHSAFTTISGKV